MTSRKLYLLSNLSGMGGLLSSLLGLMALLADPLGLASWAMALAGALLIYLGIHLDYKGGIRWEEEERARNPRGLR